MNDLLFAVRQLRKNPGFAVASILTLGLGIGVNTAIFSVIHAVLLRPLPYVESDRLMLIREKQPEFENSSVSYLNYLDVCAEQKSFTDLALIRSEGINLAGVGIGGDPEQLGGGRVSANCLTILGLKPTMGRDFLVADDTPGGAKTAMISTRLWQRRFGGDPAILGRSAQINGAPHEIIGVLPESFGVMRNPDILVTFGEQRSAPGMQNRGNHPGLSILGRLKPGFTPEQALADLNNNMAALEKQYPNSNTGVRSNLQPLLESAVGEYRQSLFILVVAVGCVLLIACANVANLMLARVTARQRELAVRSALGAGRGRLIRQLLAECLVMSVGGAVLGILLATWGRDLIVALSPDNNSRFQDVRVDGVVLAFATGISLLTALIFGLWPAWQAANDNGLSESLNEGSRGGSGGVRSRRVRSALVVAQVAMALVLLAGAGLMIRSFFNLQRVKLGFDPEQVVTMAIQLPEARYDKDEKINAFYGQLLERVRSLPGVTNASTIQNPPFGRSTWTSSYHLKGTPPAQPGRDLNAECNAVSPGAFATLRMPIVQGRDFTPDDGPDKPMVVLVDQAFARKHFPNGDAVGQLIDNNTVEDEDKAPPMTIIGVVPTTRTSALQTEPEFVQMYYSAPQRSAAERVLLVRTAGGNPLAIASAIKREMAGLDADQPIAKVRTLVDNVASSLASRRLTMTLLGSFAALALALAAIGLYGVMSLSVAQRTREMGIRLALGAEARDIFRMILRQGMSLVAVGVGIGVTGALLLAKVMQSLLYGVSIMDPPVFILVAVTLGACAFLACWLPARRATRVDPMVALRTD